MEETLAASFRRRRDEAGLSREELARRIGMSTEWIKSVESGKVEQPRAASLVRAAEGLRVDPAEFLQAAGISVLATGSDQAATFLSPERHEAIHASFLSLQRLSPERLRLAQEFLKILVDLEEFELQRRVK